MKCVKVTGYICSKDGSDINAVDVCDDILDKLGEIYNIYGSFGTVDYPYDEDTQWPGEDE